MEFEQVLSWLLSCARNAGILRKGVHLSLLPPPRFLAMAWGPWSNLGRQRAAGQGAVLNLLSACESEMMELWELESTEHPESSAASGLRGLT